MICGGQALRAMDALRACRAAILVLCALHARAHARCCGCAIDRPIRLDQGGSVHPRPPDRCLPADGSKNNYRLSLVARLEPRDDVLHHHRQQPVVQRRCTPDRRAWSPQASRASERARSRRVMTRSISQNR